MIKLHIITPCSRPENLGTIGLNIRTELAEHFDITWHVVPNKGESWGNKARNQALASIKPEGWTYFLDDDNLIYPGWGRALLKAIKSNPEREMFLFQQTLNNGNIRFLHPEEFQHRYFDTAQFIIKSSIAIQGTWVEDKYDADWYYVIYCRDKLLVEPLVIYETLVYYNALR